MIIFYFFIYNLPKEHKRVYLCHILYINKKNNSHQDCYYCSQGGYPSCYSIDNEQVAAYRIQQDASKDAMRYYYLRAYGANGIRNVIKMRE